MAFSRLGCGVLVAVLAPLALLAACPQPAWNQSTLKAIKAESETLMVTYPARPPGHVTRVPKDKWPPTIANLQPEFVTVHTWGVDITTKPYFDGGWGYHVGPSSKAELPMLPGCYSEPSPGVFWHGPC